MCCVGSAKTCNTMLKLLGKHASGFSGSLTLVCLTLVCVPGKLGAPLPSAIVQHKDSPRWFGSIVILALCGCDQGWAAI